MLRNLYDVCCKTISFFYWQKRALKIHCVPENDTGSGETDSDSALNKDVSSRSQLRLSRSNRATTASMSGLPSSRGRVGLPTHAPMYKHNPLCTPRCLPEKTEEDQKRLPWQQSVFNARTDGPSRKESHFDINMERWRVLLHSARWMARLIEG